MLGLEGYSYMLWPEGCSYMLGLGKRVSVLARAGIEEGRENSTCCCGDSTHGPGSGGLTR